MHANVYLINKTRKTGQSQKTCSFFYKNCFSVVYVVQATEMIFKTPKLG